jgi:hypothetical protein
MNIPRIEAKFTFNDGGHGDFHAKFEWLKERLHHAQELGIIPGQNVEPPPPYDLEPGPSSGAPTAQATAGDTSTSTTGQQQQPQPPQPAPDEPPPDCVEAVSLSSPTFVPVVLQRRHRWQLFET